MRLIILALIFLMPPQFASAQSRAVMEESTRYQACLTRIEREPQDAFEDALTWRMQGGGWPARHCESRALMALGEISNAADMLETLAVHGHFGPQDVTFQTRFLIEAGDAWLQDHQPANARRAYLAGLALSPDHLDLLLGQAGALSALQQWDDLRDLSNRLIDQAPYLAASWRYRALAHLELGALDYARSDIFSALERAPDDIDVLVLRGRILDALRST